MTAEFGQKKKISRNIRDNERSPADGGQVERGWISLTQLAIHLFAPSHFIDELALEDVDVRIQLQERQQRAAVRASV